MFIQKAEVGVGGAAGISVLSKDHKFKACLSYTVVAYSVPITGEPRQALVKGPRGGSEP